jgi:hypothetical protein
MNRVLRKLDCAHGLKDLAQRVYRYIAMALALTVVLGGASPAAADFIFTTLQGLTANGINDSGQIVGDLYPGGGGYVYSGGSYTPINLPNMTQFSATFPNAINNAGQIVGTYFIGSGAGEPTLGFLYSGGHYSTFDAPGASSYGGTQAYGIKQCGADRWQFQG